MVKKRGTLRKNTKIALIIISILIFIGISVFCIVYFSAPKDSFSVRPILIKLSMPKEQELINTIKVTNNLNIQQAFNIYFKNLDELAFVEENDFVLEPGESKDVKIHFKDLTKEVNIYLGQLIIEDSLLMKKIPVMVTVEDKSNVFAVIHTLISKYDNIYPGGKLGLEIKVVDVTGEVESPNVRGRYSIKDFDGNLVWMGEGDLIVGESWAEIINIPSNIQYGDYVFVTLIDYKDMKSVSGYLFSVTEKKKEFLNQNTIPLIIVLVFIIIIIALFFYFIKTRDELLLNLKKQQGRELRENLKFISGYKERLKTIPNKREKKKKIRQLRTIRKKIIKRIRHKQKEQKREIKKLKKQGKKSEIQMRLKEWEKQGYHMMEAKQEIRKLSKSNINKQMKNWQKTGYKFN